MVLEKGTGNGWKIFVSYMKSQFEIEVDPLSTVEELKQKLVVITGVPVENQRLACKGSMLNGGKRLQDTKCADGCKVRSNK